MTGKRFNSHCCFDYGNAETNGKDDGCGTMEAIYFGNAHWQGNSGDGDGPWVGADLECGMYYGGGDETKVNKRSKSLPHEFVSLYLRGVTDGPWVGADLECGMYYGGGDETKVNKRSKS